MNLRGFRNSIEGNFGQGKITFSLNRIMPKFSYTPETAIAITFLVMNLSTWSWRLFWDFLCQCMSSTPFLCKYDYSNLSFKGLFLKKDYV